MGQRKRIDKFNDDLDAEEGTTREAEDEASRCRIKKYQGVRAAYLSHNRKAGMTLAIEAENDWRESIGLERIDV